MKGNFAKPLSTYLGTVSLTLPPALPYPVNFGNVGVCDVVDAEFPSAKTAGDSLGSLNRKF